jgi:GEVED domain/Secretion system C-terminal sorting domain/Pregnancy-associated plasma protein-A
MKTIFYFLSCFVISIIGYSQHNHLECGTPTPSEKEVELTQQFIKSFQSKAQNLRPSAETVYIPLKIHVVTDDAGNLASSFYTNKILNQELAHANEIFKKVNIQFYISGTINAIKSSKFLNFSMQGFDKLVEGDFYKSDIEDELCNPYDVPNAINIYFVNSLKILGNSAGAYASQPTTTSVKYLRSYRIICAGLGAGGYGDLRSTYFPHELGHHFSLYHTFAGIGGKELVTRGTGANCDKTGDLLCDTPADPYNDVNAADKLLCGALPPNYKDANGEIYKPDLTNIMTYYEKYCKSGFTAGQYERILAGLALRKTSTEFGKYDAPDTQVTPPTITGINNYEGGVMQLFIKDNSTNETGFIIERATSINGDFVAIGGIPENATVFTDELTGIDNITNTTFFYRVRASNSKNGYSNVFERATKTKFVCIPPVNVKCGETNANMVFRSVKAVGSTLNETYAPCVSSANYSYFSTKEFSFQTNTDYNIEGTVQNDIQAYHNIYAWIDKNRNGTFDANERIYASNYTAANKPTDKNFKFVFSTKDLVGTYTLRLRFGFTTDLRDACAGIQQGETNDYVIKVIGAYTVSAGTITTNSICSNTAISVPFTYDGAAPNADNKYILQLSDNQGNNFKDLVTTINGTNLKATIPASIVAGTGYKIKIVTTSPVSTSISPTTLTIKALPTVAFVTSTATTQLGQAVDVKFTLTGDAPFKIKLSDGKTYDLADANTSIKLSPTETTEYKITSVSNGCGEGTFSSTGLKITYIASVQTNDITNTNICPAGELVVPFVLDGKVDAANKYIAQLSDNQGLNFKDIVSVLDGTNIKATIPKDTKAGTGYKVRVNASSPVLVGSVSKSTITIKPLPTAAFEVKEATIDQYKTAEVKVVLTGDAPFKLKLSDGQNLDFTDLIGVIKLGPNTTTEYKLTSVSNVCGEGFVSDIAFKLNINPILSTNKDDLEIGLKIFPNPTTEQITFRVLGLKNTKSRIQIIDNQGVIIFEKEIIDFEDSINLQGVTSGNYIIRLMQGEQVISKKMLKL